jgi:hypothetical protein
MPGERFLASARNDNKETRSCHLESFGALRINSVGDLSLTVVAHTAAFFKGVVHDLTLAHRG